MNGGRHPRFSVLVTGAVGGIGLATARLFAGRGYTTFGGPFDASGDLSPLTPRTG